jgi:NAD(P)-dependent dehydrogenase (short-subunit alcohol dehydrogenase family)
MGVLENKVAVITGASSGIGRATAVKFASEGAKVVLAARRSDRGNEVAEQIRQSGGVATFVQTDVTQPDQVQRMVNTAVEEYGRLDCAFNNAGNLTGLAPVHEISIDDWDTSTDVNLKGVWLCMKYEITQMLKNGGGSIVNDSSAGGLKGASGAAAYSAAKHGVIGLTKSAALGYGKQGIRVNAICPGWVHTEMTDFMVQADGQTPGMNHPLGRGGTPEEIAEAVTWLCSDAASFVTAVAMPVDGGHVAK